MPPCPFRGLEATFPPRGAAVARPWPDFPSPLERGSLHRPSAHSRLRVRCARVESVSVPTCPGPAPLRSLSGRCPGLRLPLSPELAFAPQLSLCKQAMSTSVSCRGDTVNNPYVEVWVLDSSLVKAVGPIPSGCPALPPGGPLL